VAYGMRLLWEYTCIKKKGDDIKDVVCDDRGPVGANQYEARKISCQANVTAGHSTPHGRCNSLKPERLPIETPTAFSAMRGARARRGRERGRCAGAKRNGGDVNGSM
jgi:hypothetical protein